MIIQILSNLFEEGYVSRENYTSLSPFFAGANVAFRKKALDQVGAITGPLLFSAVFLLKGGYRLLELLYNMEIRSFLGFNARKLVMEKYSWNRTAMLFEEIYDKTIKTFTDKHS